MEADLTGAFDGAACCSATADFLIGSSTAGYEHIHARHANDNQATTNYSRYYYGSRLLHKTHVIASQTYNGACCTEIQQTIKTQCQ